MARDVSALSPHELKITILVTDGGFNKQIAHEMHVTETTAKAQVTAISHKLHVKSRTQTAEASHVFLSILKR